MKKKEYSVEIGGKTLTAIFSDLAEQAHGSVILKYGETIVLATACMSKDKQEGLGFFNYSLFSSVKNILSADCCSIVRGSLFEQEARRA